MMKKDDFIKKFHNDYVFRNHVRKDLNADVIGSNVIFFNDDGSVKYIAGAHVKS